MCIRDRPRINKRSESDSFYHADHKEKKIFSP